MSHRAVADLFYLCDNQDKELFDADKLFIESVYHNHRATITFSILPSAGVLAVYNKILNLAVHHLKE